ncbi:restriction endonuclease subunit S [Bacillus halotolerans]|uniref:restriction endonuclease subunit S n=1 Tax=Bacillus halotolerans TaxID=260554 RepID=UPI000FD92E30|nr:restriction endonuclease subunit S [Bacillus halotolerans]AZV50177.1 restriction endonuclease subunit S [Bacillus halotolerans]TYS22520.1 restriction endonuclease subunit S [Bacillus subtilis]
MSDKITNSPQFRFAGYTDAWEQRKLGEVYTERNERGNNSLPILSVSIHHGISKGELDSSSLGKVVRRSEDKSLYKSVHSGDLVFNMMRAWQGAIGVAKIEGMVSPAYITAIPNEKLFPPFMNYCLRRHEIINQINNFSYGVTDFRKRLYWDSFSKVSCFIPSVPEQIKINLFFNHLDNLITLHQRKLELLKDMKKGLLQKMFPKDGANVPEIRFVGFTDAWEQREVGEFLEESKIKGSDGSVAKKLTVKLWRKGIVLKEEIYKGSIATQYYIRKSGQFMYGKLDFLNQAFGIVPDELDGYESTLDSPAFDFKNDLNPNFFLEYVALERFYKYQGNIANGSRKAKRIHVETFFRMPIPIPSYEEQQKIGSFFKQLDDTITLHQHELNSLKDLKKSLLQKMFV